LLLDVILSKMKFLLKILTAFIIFFIFLFFSKASFADISRESCLSGIERKDLSEQQYSECIVLLEPESLFLEGEIENISDKIKKYELTIAIANAKILKSLKEIESLEEEIESLDSKIFKLDLSLDQLSEILIERISETYKKGRINVFNLFLSSNSFSNFVSRYKYLRVIQLHDRDLMFQLETARTNFKDQKTLKEEKQEELEIAKNNLRIQQEKLAKYKKDHEELKALKEEEKKVIDKLLAEAKVQLQKFKTFTSGVGAIDPVNIHDDWGKYYSQRDNRWAYNRVGNSSYDILSVGCLLTSVSMVFSHYGYDSTPADIATNSDNFYYGSAYMNRPWVTPPGKTWVPYSKTNKNSIVPESWIKNEIAAGHPVIVGLKIYGGSYADHFVVVRNVEGDNLMMNDPLIPEVKIKLRDKYPTAVLMNAASYH